MEYSRHILQVFVGQLSSQYEALSIEVSKQTSCLEIVACIVQRLRLSDPSHYELAEVIGNAGGQDCKERRLGPHETPVALQMLWPQSSITENPQDFEQHEYRFCLREKSSSDSFWAEPSQLDSQLIRDYFYKFLYQPKDKEYPDLCQLSNLNEQTLLENLRARFNRGHIYTYVGSILISVNPFKYYPIYNPKYVKLYQNHRLGELPPHIFAIADTAYHSMLKQRKNQCIVISGESGSGKTEATLFLLHHLTMLSQKGSHGSGVEQTILSSGPVLEAFGNAKTAHNNNSSRFGKFIQVTYKENGLVQGACVQKYLLEKSRICSQACNERSYHVFYYLLAGASNQERQTLNLLKPSDYRYLSQSLCYTIDGCDEQYEFVRLKQSMEMVGFTPDKQYRLFALLSAILLIGNLEFSPKKSTYHHDESVVVRNWELACTIAGLLGVSEETLVNAITSKKAKVQGEILVINYRLPEAIAARDALAKCLYGALFDWIVLQVNYSLISLKDQTMEQNGNSIGVLDIFGFEDFGNHNRFEQFCINYANEHLQHYFNQHVFEYEQEEYRREGISWTNIGFKDNIDCLALIEGKPNGLLCVLDDQCSFPGATNETFLQKINTVHKDNEYYEIPQKREAAFIIRHYAGKVKYQVEDIREKNLDLMRPELISVLKNSRFNIVRELAGADPVAVFRWAILRAFFRAVSAFQFALSKSRKKGNDHQRKLKQKVSVDNSRILAAIENTQKCSNDNKIINFNFYSPVNPPSRLSKSWHIRRLRKTRHNRSRSRSHGPRNQKNLKSVKALAQKTLTLTSQGRYLGSRKSPHTVTGQFQMSLQALMEALNQANPYFIRCIKSNATKEPNMFDNELVQRQLRYTGMLETVRIRQAGFNVRMMFDEFIQHYRILLPNGLLSSQSDVKEFLLLMQLDRSEYQIGKTKIFMRESQKQKLDSLLHQTILSRIIFIQRWYRTKRQRKNFLIIRTAAIKIQAQVRCWLAQQMANNLRIQYHAAVCIQRMWKGYKVRTWYKTLRHSIIRIQARIRGKQTRENFEEMRKVYYENKKKMKEYLSPQPLYVHLISDSREESPTSRAESFQSNTTLSSSSSSLKESDLHAYDQQLTAPPRRKSGTALRRVPIDNLINDTYQETTKRRSSSDANTYIQESSSASLRRSSETALSLIRRHPPLKQRRSDDTLTGYTPPLSPVSSKSEKNDFDGTKPVKTRSFRHRPYQKIPDGGEVKQDIDRTSVSLSEEERFAGSAVKFPKIKRHFKSFINKREGSVSESDDNSNDSSGPQTPTSSTIGDTVSFVPQDHLPNTSSYKSFPPLETGVRLKKENVKISRQISNEKKSSSGSLDTEKVSFVVVNDGSGGSISSGTAPKGDEIKKLVAISTHNLKQSQLRKGEMCSSCDKPFTKFFVNQGFKCTTCKKLFHSACLRNSFNIPCLFVNGSSGKENASPALKKIRRQDEGNWNLTGTSQFIDRSDEVIKDTNELKALEEFIIRKIYSLETKSEDRLDTISQGMNSELESLSIPMRERKDSQVDQLFCKSLKAFKCYLVSAYSVASQNDTTEVVMVLKYKDLIKNFEKEMNNLICKESEGESVFPITMGVNAFRGFLDEFIRDKPKRQEDKVVKKRKRPRRKKKEKKTEEVSYGTHNFIHIFVNIYTQCEVCNSILWLSTKALSCQKCKVTCHQKCLNKVEQTCSQNSSTKAVVVGLEGSRKGSSSGILKSQPLRPVHRGKVFGVPLENLVGEEEKIPSVVEKILASLEFHGLYTEGLYRKSGASSKVREIKSLIDEEPETASFEDVPIHVLTAIFKTYLRELPEPLLTFDAYDPLLHASALEDESDMFQSALNVINRLPKPNFYLLERLVFHLALVALYESYNRMNSSSLAIVFSPCILRSPRSVPVQDALDDISKQTQVVELLIKRQLNKVNDQMRHIETIDKESISAVTKLNSLRANRLQSLYNSSDTSDGHALAPKMDPRDALALYKLEEQLNECEEKKCRLTLGLTELVRGSSEEELLSTDLSHAGSLEDMTSTTTTTGYGSTTSRSITSTPSLSLDDAEDLASYIRKRKSVKSNSEGDDRSITSRLQAEFTEDTVMV